MNDYGLSVLSHYGLTAEKTTRVRGALLCQTEGGLKRISPFGNAKAKLELRYVLQCQISESGMLRCDQPIKNEEGELLTKGEDGGMYLVQNWYPGHECEAKEAGDFTRAADALARLHTVAHLPVQKEYQKESLLSECGRHNRELRKIRRYLQQKKKKNAFEKRLQSSLGTYLEKGETMCGHLAESSYKMLEEKAGEEGSICHGDYSQHHILLENAGEETVVHFDQWNFDVPMADLCHFMRKILEKHNWNLAAADQILEAYNKRKPLTKEELENLQLRLSYPWKFWKIANRYYGSRKSWLASKNTEKLCVLQAQQEKWEKFLENFGKLR